MASYEECQELKNIRYKTMLQTSSNNKLLISTLTKDISNANLLLDKECNNNKKESWNKLDKSIKMDKICNYIDLISNNYNLTKEEKVILKEYLSNQIDKKNLLKNKDIIYSKDKGIIDNIPILHFNNITRRFTLKKSNQHVSTVKALGPTKNNKSRNSKKSNNIKIE
tara:strand:+ start:170 stop:670 length:501 start_codon:yes stop_codon:yes gene_type:complete